MIPSRIHSASGDDPQLDGYIRAYGGMFVGYARDELGFNTESPITCYQRT